MRILKGTVSNFRGFRDEREIPLDSNVVILRGPNGSGKTSLVDAIQWVLLGDIPRLKASVLKGDEDYVSNRYAIGPPFVEIDLATSDGLIRISRRGLGRTMQVQVDGLEEKLVGEAAQDWINARIGGGGSDTKHAEMLRRYLLQQDEMREFLSADTKERYGFVAELTGMEQLTRLDSQMTEELKTLRKSLRELEDQTENAEQQLSVATTSSAEAREVLARQQPAPSEIGAARSAAAAILGEETKGIRDPGELVDLLEGRSEAIATLLRQTQMLEERESKTREELDSLPSDSAADLAQLETRMETTAAAITRLDASRTKAVEELQAARSRADNAQQLAALALEQIDGPCPVCGQEHDVPATREHLESMLKQIPELRDLTDRVDRIKEESEATRETLGTQESELARLNSAEQERSRAEEVLEEVATLRDVAARQIAGLIEGRGASAFPPSEELLRRGAVQRASIDETSRRLRSALAEERSAARSLRHSESLDVQVETRGERLAYLSAQTSAHRKRVKRAERARSALGEMLVELSSQVANTSTPLINEIYRRLEVHPTFRTFGFRIQRHRESGHLRPWVYDERRGEDGNAMHVLSAAQLNSLAICLFLALNLERETDLMTAILDDPVQSLDDLNLLSLADVLRTFRVQRQVIISTHDETLAELLIRKLRPVRGEDSTLVVTLDQWAEVGPRVRWEKRDAPVLEPELELLRDTSY